MIYSAFRHQRPAALESFCFHKEKRNSNASSNPQALAQALFERPALEDEICISTVIRQPLTAVRSLLARNRIYNFRFERRRNTVERKRVVRRYCEGFTIPQCEDYLRLVRKDSRSRIIVSFHYGDFLFGSASLLRIDQSTHRYYVLNLNKASEACYTNLAAGFGSCAPLPDSELLLENTSPAQLSQILRAPNNSLILFCDVPGGLNQQTKVKFLNRPAWFSTGPAILALTNRVPLLPLINFSTDDRSYIILAPQLEPTLLPAETLHSAAKRLTQKLVSFFESIFQEHPEQWRFLPLLPLYFVNPEK